MRLRLAALAALAAADLAAGPARTAPERAAAAEPARIRELLFTGTCDASAAVPLARDRFALADDEDNVLRVYDADRGGAPLRSIDLSASLFPPEEPKKKEKKGKKKSRKGSESPSEPARAPESDLEAGVRVGDLAFWMTSHGRNRAGKRKDARLLFFATTASGPADPLRLVGRAYDGLLDDLVADARYAPFELAAAAERAPKEAGGLNLEALGERPEGGVWIGFRNPIPGGRALVAPLLNPERVIEGERARLGDPIRLDLGGLGIRSLSRWRGETLVVAGSHADEEGSRLFQWDGRGAPAALSAIDLAGLNPEASFSREDEGEILLLSDDGVVEIDGAECKRLDDPARKRFRGWWLRLRPPH